MQRSFLNSAATLEQRLQGMVSAYQRANSFIRFENADDFNAMAETIARLPLAKRDEWAELWERVADAVKQIELPSAFRTLLDEAHHFSFEFVRQNYTGTDMHRLSFEERVNFMQVIADGQTYFWQQKFPDVFADFHGTRVEGFHYDTSLGPYPDKFSLRKDPSDEGYYYRVPDNEAGSIHFLSNIGAHEPHHSVQQHLIKKLKEGFDLPEPLREAAMIFTSFQQEGVGNIPPSLATNEDKNSENRLAKAIAEAYSNSTIETPAFYQGNRMESAMEIFSPPRLLISPDLVA